MDRESLLIAAILHIISEARQDDALYTDQRTWVAIEEAREVVEDMIKQ